MLRTHSASLLAALLAALWPIRADAQILSLSIDDALLNLDSRVTLLNGRQTYLDGQLSTVSQAATNAQSTAAQATLIAANAAAQAAANLTSLDVARARIDANSADVAILTQRAAASDASTNDNTASIANLQQQAAAGAAADQMHAAAVAGLSSRADAGDGTDQAQNTALAALQSRVAAGEAGGADNSTWVAALDARMDNAEADHAATRQQVGALETQQAEHDAQIASLSQRDAEHDARLSALQDRAADADGQAKQRDQRLTDMQAQAAADHDRVATLDARTSAQQGQIGEHAQQIAAMSAADAAFRASIANGEAGMVRRDAASGQIAIAGDMGGGTISVAGTDGNRRVTGVAAGEDDADATNVAQVRAMQARTLETATAHADQAATMMYDAAVGQTQAMISANSGVLRKEMRSIAAGSAALAGLPQAIMPGRGMIAAGIGGQDGQMSLAMGVGKSFSGRHAPVLRAGAAMDAGGHRITYNAAVGFHF